MSSSTGCTSCATNVLVRFRVTTMSHILARGAGRAFSAHVVLKVDPIAVEAFATVDPINVPAINAILGTRCASSRDHDEVGVFALEAITGGDGCATFAVRSARFAAVKTVIYVAHSADFTIVSTTIASCAVCNAILTDGVAGR